MSTEKAISAALSLIDSKKENLRKAFEELQQHSSSLSSSFTLTWPQLDSHFTSFQSSLQHKFNLLQSLQPQTLKQTQSSPLVPARPDLKTLCQNMDGLGLRRYIMDRPQERETIRAEMGDAFEHAPDAATLVLDALDTDVDVIILRRCCVLLLEELKVAEDDIGEEVRDRAMKLAVAWKGDISANSDSGGHWDVLAFLLIVAKFGLGHAFQMDDLIDLFLIVSTKRNAMELCRLLNFGDRMSDLIQKLISKGKAVLAVHFIFEFGMTDKFPPIPILKAYVKESQQVDELLESGKPSQLKNDIIAKEISDLNLVIKCIEKHNLESEYPKNNLVKQVEKLEKLRENRKRPAPASTTNHHYRLKLPNPSFPGRPYAWPDSNLEYGSQYSGSNLYPSESYMQSAYYDRQVAYGEYNLPPQYHPSYYPQ